MLKFLKWFFGLFSPYVNSFERRVDKFFQNVKSTDSSVDIRKGLLNLMQENLIVTNLWMEKKYKGYNYLDKATRRQMYANVEEIKKVFEAHLAGFKITDQEISGMLDACGLTFPRGAEEMIRHIAGIMAFLRPGKYYNYIKTASFGKLLRNPANEILEGDCNQIVTLYAYLFSLKFPLKEVQIKLLPEHVCLHFRGIDIEATNGTFQKYTECRDVLPITELISTNLLDLADFREEVQTIDERTMVKSAQLAYAISSLKSLVEKNLKIAYKNLASAALSRKNFDSAVFYLEKAGDAVALKSVYRNAAVYFMGLNDFKKAGYFAMRSGDTDLGKTVKYNEGVYYFKKDNLDEALKIFTSLGDDKMKKACYGGMYNKLVQDVKGVKTLDDAKNHKSTYRKMLDLAQKMGDSTLEKSVRATLDKI